MPRLKTSCHPYYLEKALFKVAAVQKVVNANRFEGDSVAFLPWIGKALPVFGKIRRGKTSNDGFITSEKRKTPSDVMCVHFVFPISN